jgi:hypothetical protein
MMAQPDDISQQEIDSYTRLGAALHPLLRPNLAFRPQRAKGCPLEPDEKYESPTNLNAAACPERPFARLVLAKGLLQKHATFISTIIHFHA